MFHKIILFIFSICTLTIAGDWNWQYPKPQGNNLWAIEFYNEHYGYAVGEWGTILFSSDHGLTWEIQYEGVTDNLRDIALADSITAWIVGDNGMILKTTNNGFNWIEQNGGIQNGLNAVCFWDKNNGWAVGDNKKIIKTSDGGTNWIIQVVPLIPNNISFNSVHFISLTEGWIVGSAGYILHTINGGTDWIVQKNTGATLQQIRFVNSTTGFAGWYKRFNF